MQTQGDGSDQEPLNREPKPQTLIADFLTPIGDACYDRNHGPIQHLSTDKHRVIVDGLVAQTLTLSMAELKENFSQHTVTCALQCAGNRRHSMRTRIKEVQGIDWFDAAILNAEWTGPLLRDVLIRAAVQDSQTTDLHVHLASTRTKVQDDEWYGSSIPLGMALDEQREAVLALKMNGETLPDNHGFPVRAIIPGVIGARSVKWIDRITVARTQSPNFYQQRDYKVLPPNATDDESAARFWGIVPPMMDNVINSVVIVPDDNDTVERSDDGTIIIKGYAVPQGEHGPVVKVEISCDDGASWTEARLGPKQKWSWVLWEAAVRVEPGEGICIFSRATDEGGNSQMEHRSQWNLRGIGYNGYESRTGVKVL